MWKKKRFFFEIILFIYICLQNVQSLKEIKDEQIKTGN